MQLQVHSGEPANANVDLLVLGTWADVTSQGASLKAVDSALGGALRAAAKEEDFSGKPKQQVIVNTLGKLRAKRVALVGMGPNRPCAAASFVALGGSATRLGRSVAAKHVLVVPPPAKRSSDASALRLIGRGAVLGGYDFRAYRSEKPRQSAVAKVSVYWPLQGAAKPARDALKWARVAGESVVLARDLVNASAKDLFPESFAKRAQHLGREVGLSVRVFDAKALEKMKMGLLLGVGAGSTRAPRLVHLAYKPARVGKGKPVALVGKGVTFDSGGLSLKPAASMADMKCDMAGAGAVLAAMHAIGQLRPPFAVHGILALAENMPSGSAIRPGDVLRSAMGKWVEVNNTDAEGRLVLADALHYALGLKPGRIIDLATLTGACVVALGPHTVGLFGNEDALADDLLGASERAGEDFWRMPLSPTLREQLKSDVADFKNTGERWGGAITAALFLKEFVGETPWAHLDIAGPAISTQDIAALSKGGTGVAVATLLEALVG